MVKSTASLSARVSFRVLLTLMALSALALPAQAAPAQKMYSVEISPGSVGAGQTTEYTFTATNRAGSQSLGSINLTAPLDFTFLAVTQQPSTGSAAIVGGTLQLRNLALAAGTSTTVKFTAEAPCVQSTATGANQWGLAAKQSNDFLGTRNDFTLNESLSQRITNVSGDCQLIWIAQPRSAKVGQTIRNTDYDAVDGSLDGDPIAAEVLSAPYTDSSPATRVTFSGDEVVLDIGHDPNQPDEVAQLTGTDTANAVNGVATFAPGPKINLHGLDYTLLATNPDMASGESAEFDISDAVGECAKGQCNNLKTEGDTINAELSSTSTEGIIAMSIGVLSGLECPGYVPSEQQEAVTILPLGVSSSSTMTVQITVLAAIVDRPASQYLICWASTKSFTERDGTAAEPVTISGDAMFQGLLPDCAKRNPVGPCQITPSKQDKQGNVVLAALAPGDDPHAR